MCTTGASRGHPAGAALAREAPMRCARPSASLTVKEASVQAQRIGSFEGSHVPVYTQKHGGTIGSKQAKFPAEDQICIGVDGRERLIQEQNLRMRGEDKNEGKLVAHPP